MSSVVTLGTVTRNKFFYKYGCLLEEYWNFFVLFAFVFIFISICGVGQIKSTSFKKGDHGMEKTWSERGGRLEKELNYLWDNTDSGWDITKQVVMVTERAKSNDLEIGEGGDVLTKEGLEEMLSVTKMIWGLEVTTSSGKTYTARDLCERKVLPDTNPLSPACDAVNNATFQAQCIGMLATCGSTPANCDISFITSCIMNYMGCYPITFPCTTVGPLDCFQEALEYQDPAWQFYETAGASGSNYNNYLGSNGPMLTRFVLNTFWTQVGVSLSMYSNKPSFRNMNDDDIKNEITTTPKGPGAVTGCQAWAGHVYVPDSVFVGGDNKQEASRFTYYFDAPKRISWRLKNTKPELADQNSIEEALELMDEKIEVEVDKFSSTVSHTRLGALTANAFTRNMEENNAAPMGLILLGYFIMVLILIVSLGHLTVSSLSHVDIAMVGFLLVVCSLLSGFGLIGWFGVELNGMVFQCLPFLALGLGVDDMLVLIRYFEHQRAAAIKSSSANSVLGNLMVEAGASVTLTSFCNIVAFSLGCMIRVPGMASFCASAAIVAFVNWFVMLTVMPALILFENRRLNDKRSEISFWCCQKGGEEVSVEPGKSGVVEPALLRFIETTYAPVIAMPAVKYAISAFGILFWIVCIFWASKMETGYDIHDLFPTDSVAHWSSKAMLTHVGVLPGKIVVKDIDYPSRQQEVIELYDAVLGAKYDDGSLVNQALTGNWIGGYANLLVQMAVAQNLNSTSFLDTSYTHPVLAPIGLPTSNEVQFYYFYELLATFPPVNPAMLASKAYAGADFAGLMVNGFEDNTHTSPGIDNKLTLTVFDIITRGLTETDLYVEAIEKTREAVEKSSLAGEAFPTGTVFTYWEVFVVLQQITWTAFAVDVCVIAIISGILMWSPRSALVVAVASAMIVLEVWGILSLFLRFSFMVSIPILIAVGISVEFTAHFTAYFVDAEGTLVERLTASMKIAYPPVVLGAITTFGALFPMAFASLPFLVKYFFATFAIVVFVGLFNTLVVLPAMLAAMDCGSYSVDTSLKNVEETSVEQEKPAAAVVEEASERPAATVVEEAAAGLDELPAIADEADAPQAPSMNGSRTVVLLSTIEVKKDTA
jgi:hypothetical protein